MHRKQPSEQPGGGEQWRGGQLVTMLRRAGSGPCTPHGLARVAGRTARANCRLAGRACCAALPQDESFLEEMAALPPQERIATVRPFWESLSQAQREELLTVGVEDLRAYAQRTTQRLRKQAAAEAAAAAAEAGAAGASVGVAPVALHLCPDLEEVMEEAVRRSADKGTWKVGGALGVDDQRPRVRPRIWAGCSTLCSAHLLRELSEPPPAPTRPPARRPPAGLAVAQRRGRTVRL